VEIDKPSTKYEYDQTIWLLLHKNVWIYFDDEDKWYVQFNTPCEALQEDKLCSIYNNRPAVCRKHSQDSCEKYGEGLPFKKLFTKKEQFIKYLKEKGIDYNFKSFKH
jgi:hypothetical protein